MRSPASGVPAYIFVPELGGPGAPIRLSDDESRYVARVCRVRPGEHVRATDGRGVVADLRVESLEGGVRARIESLERFQRDRRAWVVTGAPERGREDWLVEKLAELDVERWIPVDCARSRWEDSRVRPDRWERVAIAAMRQSMSPYRLATEPPVALATAIDQVPEGAGRWVATADGETVSSQDLAPVEVVVVGPAQGFEPEESRMLERRGFRAIRLSARRLRTETAAIAWASRWSAAAG